MNDTITRTRSVRTVRPAVMVATCFLVVLILLSLLIDVLPFPPYRTPEDSLSEPMMLPPFQDLRHPLGTNQFGLDLLGRALYGARISILVSVSAAVLGSIIGGVLGALSAEYKGALGSVSNTVTTALLAIPNLVLLIAIVSVFGQSHLVRAISFSVLAIPMTYRIARAAALSLAQRDYVLVARALGFSRWRIIWRDIIPGIYRPLLGYIFVLLPLFIVADAGLSFLGLGAVQPEPTWGNMIGEGLGGVFERAPYIVFVPSLFLLSTVMSLDVIRQHFQRKAS